MHAVVDSHHPLAAADIRQSSDGAATESRAVFGRARPVAPRVSLYLPLALVVVALALLALLPLVEQHRIGTRLDQITQVIDPARIAIGDMQIALALEVAGVRGFLLTGNEDYAATYRSARAERRRAYARLRELSPSLDRSHAATIVAMGVLLQDADALLDAFFTGTMTREAFIARLSEQQTRFVAITGATGRLQHDVRLAAAVRRNEVHQIHTSGSYLSVFGVLVALAAVISVARLSSRHRALAALERTSREDAERAHAEAERRREEAERLGASREGLMRGFSHDVKNAIGAADGYLFMLQEGVMTPLNATQHAGVEKSRRCLQTANQLIEDLLEFARAQAGEMVLHLGATDLRQLVLRVAGDYRIQADAHGLAFAVDVAGEFPLIDTDAERVTQIVSNLLSNAVKYTHAGGVTLRLALREGDDGTSYAVVDVIDTGPGIPDEARAMIFDEFRRFDVAGGRRGTGIGLAISQRIATMLGGRITVESASGRGSTFTLWLPLRACGPATT